MHKPDFILRRDGDLDGYEQNSLNKLAFPWYRFWNGPGGGNISKQHHWQSKDYVRKCNFSKRA